MENSNYWYLKLIQKYISPDSQAYPFIMIHSTLVTNKALKIARKLNLSKDSLSFIEEAAMLHDIGICEVEDEDFGTKGGPYITHGIRGASILTAEGYSSHARVAESHTGVGIYKDQIIENKLPLPEKDYIAETVEEKIISYADLFYSKIPDLIWYEKSIEEVKQSVSKFGARAKKTLDEWIIQFGE